MINRVGLNIIQTKKGKWSFVFVVSVIEQKVITHQKRRGKVGKGGVIMCKITWLEYAENILNDIYDELDKGRICVWVQTYFKEKELEMKEDKQMKQNNEYVFILTGGSELDENASFQLSKDIENVAQGWGLKSYLDDVFLPDNISWDAQLQPIINEYKNGDDTALDGDEVDCLCKIIKARINLHEGNITEQEYNSILG